MVSFTPHLVPLNRGLFTTASVPLARPASTADLIALYREFYAGEPFVRVLDEGQRPATRAVVGLEFLRRHRRGRPAHVRAPSASPRSTTSARAAPPNGMQSLNIMMGWDERTGLEAPPVYP